MKKTRASFWRSVAMLTIVVLAGLSVRELKACSTPVFRYALERWMPDYYELHISIPDGGEVPAWVVEVIEKEEGSRPNAFVRKIENSTVKQPTMSVHFPRAPKEVPPIWEGSLTRETLAAVLSSPVRDEAARKIIDGNSAVWLFLGCPDKEKNSAAMAALKKELDVLGKELMLPVDPLAMMEQQEGEEAPEPEGISFSILTIKRDDPKEEFLRSMLLLTEPDLRELSGEPMAFPVYGRGRALYALVGKGIHEDVIAEACVFLTGACSCQVKAQNPGVDLLMTADWDEVFYGQEIEEEPPPTLTGVMPSPLAEDGVSEKPEKPVEDLPEEEQVSTPPEGAISQESEDKGTLVPVVMAAIFAGLVVLVGGGAVLFAARGRQ